MLAIILDSYKKEGREREAMVTKVNRPSLISGSFRNNKKIIIQTELLFDLVGISALNLGYLI